MTSLKYKQFVVQNMDKPVEDTEMKSPQGNKF